MGIGWDWVAMGMEIGYEWNGNAMGIGREYDWNVLGIGCDRKRKLMAVVQGAIQTLPCHLSDKT